MALSGERLASLLAYCRIEEPAEEELLTLEGLYDAAVGYMDGAGVAQPEEGTPRRSQYDLCVNALVLDWWDHRDTKEQAAQAEDNAAFRRLIVQLKLTEA